MAFSRIDGAPSLFEAIVNPQYVLRPSSTAAKLQALGSADFVWQGPSGASILAHYIAGFGLYCHGDNIDYDEVLQTQAGHTGQYRGDSSAFTDARIASYHKELAPWSKTPYLFVPVGRDFQSPKQHLADYLDGYNQRNYAGTGTWTVAASFEDYAKLVNFHKAKLPTLQGELSPVYMGFYGSRGAVKRRVRAALRQFLAAEMLASRQLADSAAPALAKLTRSNHHDYVTGTSTDAVVAQEQLPQLAEARLAGESYLNLSIAQFAATVAGDVGASGLILLNPSSQPLQGLVQAVVPTSHVGNSMITLNLNGVPLPTELVTLPQAATVIVRAQVDQFAPWQAAMVSVAYLQSPQPKNPVAVALLDSSGKPVAAADAVQIVLDNGHVRAQLQRSSGQVHLASLMIGGELALVGPTAQLIDYADTGGLWRMGHEMANCSFVATPLPADTTPSVRLVENTPLLGRVRIASGLVALEVWLGAGDAGLSFAVETAAPQGRSRVLALNLNSAEDPNLLTSTPFGYVTHGGQSQFAPTFWPAVQ
ncbi:MAG: hypothetical protein EXR77_07360 [Myxococcales bacterium]|nr:hypothetical protein [Myxococcales bacterium]